jgi:colanic acid biosynthesis glycosyl transferase WcaI
MRILVYGLNFYPELTGVGKYTGEMGFWLAKRGYKVRVITSHPYYPKWKSEIRFHYSKDLINGVEIFRCPIYVPNKYTGLKRLIHLFSFAISSFPIILFSITWRPTVIWTVAPTFFTSPLTLFIAKITNSKTWIHIQDFELDAAFSLGLIKSGIYKSIPFYFEKMILKKFDCVSTISSKMLRKLHEKGVDECRTYYFPNWVDTKKIKPLDSQNEICELKYFKRSIGINDDKKKIVLYSGNLGKKQGVDIILEVANIFEKTTDVLFVICGDGVYSREIIKKGSLLKNILMIPPQSDRDFNYLLNSATAHIVPQLANAADLVLPSKLSGIFASGKPVLVTADEGTDLYDIVSGKGIAVRPGLKYDFANNLARLLNNENLCKKLGLSAREFAVENLDLNKVLHMFELRLKDLVKC